MMPGPPIAVLSGRIEIIAAAAVKGAATLELGVASGETFHVLHHVSSGAAAERALLARTGGSAADDAPVGSHLAVRATGGPGGAALAPLTWTLVSPGTPVTAVRALGGLRVGAVRSFCRQGVLVEDLEELPDGTRMSLAAGGWRHLLGQLAGVVTVLGTLTPRGHANRTIVVPVGSIPVSTVATAGTVIHVFDRTSWGFVCNREPSATWNAAWSLGRRLAAMAFKRRERLLESIL
jgi:hypothetical protein